MLMKNKKAYNYNLLDSKEKKLKVLVEYLSRSSYMQATNLSIVSESQASILDHPGFEAGNKSFGLKQNSNMMRVRNTTLHQQSVSDSREHIGTVPEENFRSSFSPDNHIKPSNLGQMAMQTVN